MALRTDETTGLKVEVVEQYRDWSPRLPAKRIVERLLAESPTRFLAGLSQVTLTNSQALNHRERRQKVPYRGRKLRLADARGYYLCRSRGRSASIVLLVDNIEAPAKSWLWVFRFLPVPVAVMFGSVLFHELGHHIHATQRPEHREGEDVADDWSNRLLRIYFENRHRVFLHSYQWLGRFLRRVRGMFTRRARQPSAG